MAAGTATGHAVEYDQMNTAITNATSGLGNALHAPVQNLAAAKSIVSGGRTDKMLMNIEDLGLYRFDAESVIASNDAGVIRPTDIASDASAGRWIQLASSLNDHNLLNGKQGGLANEYYHLSAAELAKLTTGFNAAALAAAPAETVATIGTIINGSTTDATPVDADLMPMLDSTAGNVLKKLTLLTLKAYFALGFTAENTANKDASNGYVGLTLFKINFKNVLGTFTSFFTNANTASRTYTYQDRSGTIADDTDITSAKARANHTGTQLAATISDLATAVSSAAPAETTQTIGTLIAVTAAAKATPVDADNFGFSDSAATNILKKFTWANLYAALFGKISGDVTVSSTGVSAIGAAKVTSAMMVNMGANTVKGSVAGGVPTDLTVAQMKTMLGLTVANQSTRVYRAVPATGAVDGANKSFGFTGVTGISGSEEVFVNGILQNVGAGNDYTISYASPMTITFVVAPLSTAFADVILVNYSV